MLHKIKRLLDSGVNPRREPELVETPSKARVNIDDSHQHMEWGSHDYSTGAISSRCSGTADSGARVTLRRLESYDVVSDPGFSAACLDFAGLYPAVMRDLSHISSDSPRKKDAENDYDDLIRKAQEK